MLIGILQTGRAPEELRPRTGDYPEMFEALLSRPGFDFRTWHVEAGAFPDGPEAADGWLITGSKHGAYEDHDWIPPLERLIRQIRAAGRPLVGICFGHQIIAQALGGKVAKWPGGWAVGRTVYDWQGRPLALNAWHQDQITEKPAEAEVVATHPHCAYAALLYDDEIFTVQAHPEFGAEVVEGLADTRGRGVVPAAQLDAARAQLDAPTDRTEVGEMIARFLTERRIA
ncbi:MAG: type 1 glutamine amidotransferase [Rhodosalinus sp.]